MRTAGGVRLPCRRCQPSSSLFLKPHPYLALDKADGIATLTLGTVEPPPWARSRETRSVFCARAFLRREIDKFSHSFFSVWIDVVLLPPEDAVVQFLSVIFCERRKKEMNQKNSTRSAGASGSIKTTSATSSAAMSTPTARSSRGSTPPSASCGRRSRRCTWGCSKDALRHAGAQPH